MSTAVEEAEEIATQAKNQMKHNGDRVREGAKDAADDVSAQWKRWSDDFAGYCRERPMQAVGIGALAGAVMGILLIKGLGRHETSAETKIRKVVRVGEEKWRQVKDGLTQTAHGFKGVMDAFTDR